MKLRFNNLYLLTTLYLIIFLLEFIFTKENNFSSFMETGIEEDLIRLISKIHNEKLQKKEKEKNLIDVKIENLFDIKEYLKTIELIKFKNENDKEEYKKSLENLKIKNEHEIETLQNQLKQIQIKYDYIIDKSNILSKDLNEKKIQELKEKADYDAIKSELETKSDKLSSKFKNLKKNFEKRNEEFIDFNKKISNINHILKNQKVSKTEYLNKKREHNFMDKEIILNNKLLKEEESDKKFFDLINTNISKEAKEINLSSIKSNVKIQNLQKISFDNENHRKLEMEKDQQYEFSREYNNKIKELLKNNENLENDVKDLMIKKNKLKVDIYKKEIENKLKNNEFKKEINNLNDNIKKTENEMLNNVKEQKKVIFLFIR